MANGDEPSKTPNTDNQETSVLGNAPVAVGKSSDSAPGTLLNDRYLLVRQLNAGGFGTVHLAHDQQMHGRPVVVKIQINQRVDDPWFERKFSEEVRALSLLDHPGVVVAFDSGRTSDGMPFLVMQYVEGNTLRAVMHQDGMPLAQAAGILKQLGHALGAAHEKGIWHRDLKPENVMLQPSPGADDRVRLIDFGIATVADVQSKYQTSTRVAGSVLYMAPEQTIGQPTAMTDIYAMGLIAYEMVTGRRPFPAENAIQMIAMQQLPVRVKPSDLRPSLPVAAERWILQSLDPEPTKRPPSARLFGDQLHDTLIGIGGVGAGGAQSVVAAASWQTPPPPPRPPPPPAFAAAAARPASPPQPAEKKSSRWKSLWIAIGMIAAFSSVFKDCGRQPKASGSKVVTKPDRGEESDTAKTAQSAPVTEDAIELAFWNSVKDSTEPRLYQEYLSKYPEGSFASLAKTKIDILSKKEGPKSASPPVKSFDSELAFWSSLKSEDGAQRYKDYLSRYPNGMFATVAQVALAAKETAANAKEAAERRGIPAPPEPPTSADESSPNFRRKLAPERDPLNVVSYSGPMEGDLRWKGRVLNNTGLIIQGGQANSGELVGDLPRVPVTVEVVSGKAVVIVAPANRNKWDHIALRNLSGSPLKSVVIHWKVIK